MKLTLETQQVEMRSSFADVHSRIDALSLQLDSHRKETALNFRQIDQRFDRLEGRIDVLEGRFDVLERRFDVLEGRFDKLPSELATALSPYFRNIEVMLENHEKRIWALEQ
jgi:uncharacterized protein involved in exopolysaccharide biosynthesis